MRPILLVPGLHNAGPGHWLSLWEGNMRDATRVAMPNWDHPRRPEWVEALDQAIRRANDGGAPPVLVAHSLGCLAIAHWASEHHQPVHGALLVAPPDVERPEALEVLRAWAPIPWRGLPFPAHVVASSDDPHCDLARARAIAEAWDARFTNVGPRGHLNLAAGFGEWPRGEAFLQELIH